MKPETWAILVVAIEVIGNRVFNPLVRCLWNHLYVVITADPVKRFKVDCVRHDTDRVLILAHIILHFIL